MSAIKIAPSILSADMANLAHDLERISNADFIHVDVMDGHFVPNLSYGTAIVKACKGATDIPLDVHLMISNPDSTVDWYIDAGADLITVHYEASTHLNRTISHIKQRGCKAGVVLNPATPVTVLEDILDELDMVLLMSVNPGFGGQAFIGRTLSKIEALRVLCDQHGVRPLIEVDGGVGEPNAEAICRAGANVLVAGSAVFGAEDPSAAVEAIRCAGERGHLACGE
ncbi:MAG: ribulose-phosphate 3-epimerase [Coriobacteriaceae bacterium]|nr:ribulose-phosphate 3-epimerase [Coriobacteriaceae bacterium]